jgi:hypothetical protein
VVWTCLYTDSYQPRYPIVLGSIVVVISLGLIQMAMDQNKQSQVNGCVTSIHALCYAVLISDACRFMVMAGAGVGLTGGPLGIQARFAQGDHRVAAVTGLSLFVCIFSYAAQQSILIIYFAIQFRSLGGTVGLAQCAAVLSSKVTAFLRDAAKSGTVPASTIAALAHANADLTSIQSIDALPQDAQELVRNAFRNGTRWTFISLIPWCGLAVFLAAFLSKIPDSDRLRKEGVKNELEKARGVDLEVNNIVAEKSGEGFGVHA